MNINLNTIIDNYNNSYHRGIGMSPNEAMLASNHLKVRLHEKKYIKEFNKRNKFTKKYKIGESVMLKNELKRKKTDKNFKETGKITKHLYGDVYEIRTDKGKVEKRHTSQLRRMFEPGKLDGMRPSGTNDRVSNTESKELIAVDDRVADSR